MDNGICAKAHGLTHTGRTADWLHSISTHGGSPPHTYTHTVGSGWDPDLPGWTDQVILIIFQFPKEHLYKVLQPHMWCKKQQANEQKYWTEKRRCVTDSITGNKALLNFSCRYCLMCFPAHRLQICSGFTLVVMLNRSIVLEQWKLMRSWVEWEPASPRMAQNFPFSWFWGQNCVENNKNFLIIKDILSPFNAKDLRLYSITGPCIKGPWL